MTGYDGAMPKLDISAEEYVKPLPDTGIYHRVVLTIGGDIFYHEAVSPEDARSVALRTARRLGLDKGETE